MSFQLTDDAAQVVLMLVRCYHELKIDDGANLMLQFGQRRVGGGVEWC